MAARNILIIITLCLFSIVVSPAQNSAMNMMEDKRALTIGGYAQMDYNQPFGNDLSHNGKLDVHRLVLLFGYKFNSKTQFITEIEFEHVSEVFIEQAFLSHRIKPWLNLRAGLMLVPMGIVNEYHEPPTFNGVERPNLDKFIVPTTWRELGVGFSGRLDGPSIRYQAYLFNGFKSYEDGDSFLSGKNGLRSGRQKGAESFMSSPNFSIKFDHYGIANLKLGLAGYFGKTQSTMFNGLDKQDNIAVSQADSTIVGVNMIGFDARYTKKGFQLRGQLNYIFLSDTEAYNSFTSSDVGSNMNGFYLEAGYNIFHKNTNISSELIPFVRYEKYNTHSSVEGDLVYNAAHNRTEITAGLGWKITPGSILKADVQWFKSKANDSYSKQLNLGVGVWFN